MPKPSLNWVQAFSLGKFGVATNYVEAVKWFRQAAEQNHAGAQNNLGVCYAEGQGVTHELYGSGEVVAQSREPE